MLSKYTIFISSLARRRSTKWRRGTTSSGFSIGNYLPHRAERLRASRAASESCKLRDSNFFWPGISPSYLGTFPGARENTRSKTSFWSIVWVNLKSTSSTRPPIPAGKPREAEYLDRYEKYNDEQTWLKIVFVALFQPLQNRATRTDHLGLSKQGQMTFRSGIER